MYIKSTYDGLHVITGTTEHVSIFFVHKEKHEFALLSLIILLDTITMAVKLPLAVSLAKETKLKSKKQQKKAKLVDWNQEASIAHPRGRVSARSLVCSLG